MLIIILVVVTLLAAGFICRFWLFKSYFEEKKAAKKLDEIEDEVQFLGPEAKLAYDAIKASQLVIEQAKTEKLSIKERIAVAQKSKELTESINELIDAVERNRAKVGKMLHQKTVREITSKFFPKRLWVLFSLFLIALPVLIFVFGRLLPLIKNHLGLSVLLTFFLSLLILISTLRKAWTTVSERNQVIITLFEKYYGTIKKSGLCFPFPLFGWIELLGICMEEQNEHLFQIPDPENPKKQKTALFDLSNASLPLEAEVFYQIVDPYKFTFNHTNSLQAMIKYVETFMRRVFVVPAVGNPGEAGYANERIMTMAEAMLLKSTDVIDDFSAEDSANGQNYYNFVLSHWGIDVFKIMVVDFVLTEAQQNALNSVLAAEKLKEASILNADTEEIRAGGVARGRIKLAEASRVELEKNGKGYLETINLLRERGVEPTDALTFMVDMKKFQNVEGATFFFGDTGGAKLGAAFNAGSQKKIVETVTK